MEVSFLSYGMVVYSHAMGEGSTVFYVAIRSVLGRSVEAKPSFMTLVAQFRQAAFYWLRLLIRLFWPETYRYPSKIS